MPAQYIDITLSEIEEHLLPQGFKNVNSKLSNTVERVYGKRMDRDGLCLTLRIYTGITPDGHSRAVGEDAIRCYAFWRDIEGVVHKVGGTKRVHRVRGWKKNLQNRIDSFEEMLGPKCPICKSPMVERKGKTGNFWGCCTYPICKGTA
jgi:hypothetical protein